MLTTPNLGLRKPENNDGFGQDDFNTNMDLLDRASGGGSVGCSLRKASGQSLANDTETAVTWDTEDVDPDGFHTGSAAEIVIPAGLGGRYRFFAHWRYTANATGRRQIIWRKNGGGAISSMILAAVALPDDTWVSGWGEDLFVAGDTLRVYGRQNSGGALSIDGSSGRIIVFQVWA